MKEPGLDRRHRDKDGEISRKHGNATVGKLRKTYGEDFAAGYRSDAKIENVLKRERVDSLAQLLKKK
jgi:hypothetical protein